ncbi:MAG TPA: histidine ammonia-lyase [Firmicutes bacterium]|nr:histidine ammonia-lyase [Bacillota bacterium]
MESVVLTGSTLTVLETEGVARRGWKVKVGEEAAQRVKAARAEVERLLNLGQPVYGITTGFGKLADVAVSPQQAAQLQGNLIRSHAAGVGDPLPEDVVRAAMLLRVNALLKGCSGIRLEVLETLVQMLNRGVHPVVPAKGSVGASGDLAPLAHIALVLSGEGEAFYRRQRLSGGEALHRAGIEPVALEAKEGLALINGTQVMSALGCLLVSECRRILGTADVAAALSLEGLRGQTAPFHPLIQEVRPHPGQQEVARNLRRLTEGSRLTTRPGELRVQDAYSLRCIPQVHGAVRDAMAHLGEILEREINSATDNPLVFPGEDLVLSGGNFHGQPLAMALDYAAIALCALGSISERRLDRLLNPVTSGLPAFLTSSGGLSSGLMLVQYTAAALVSENKTLASPASVDSIPTSAGQEDHVSMGPWAARKAGQILDNLEWVLAAELLAAAQAIEFLGADGLGAGTSPAWNLIRRHVPPLEEDRPPAPDLTVLKGLVSGGEILRAAEEEVGPLA